MFGNSAGARGKMLQGNNSRAFSLFVMVISVYTLGSLWFIMFPTRESVPLIKEEPMAVYNNRVIISDWLKWASERKQTTEAKKVDEPVIEIPDDPEIDRIIDRASELKGNKRWDEAMKELNQGLEKYPNSDKLLGHKGGWYFDREDWDNAALWFKKAHEINKKDYYWVQNVAMCLGKVGKGKEASKWLWTAYDMNPSLGTLISICDTQWKFNDFHRYQELLNLVLIQSKELIRKGQAPDINPFSALHLPFNLEEIYEIAKGQVKFMEDIANRNKNLVLEHNNWDGKRKIRVGYISPDLRHHAVGITIQNMFSYHDKEKFEIIAFSCYEESNDEITAKIRANVHEFVEVYDKDVVAAAKKINQHKPDILIDLGLFTAYARMDVFALRPAPISGAWLGLASTTGSRFYDYVIADHTVVLPEHEKFYAEKIVRMPHSYHIFDHKQYYPYTPTRRPISRNQFTTTLPDNLDNPPVFFCNYANNYRLDPYIFHRWLTIIKKTPHSALILKYYNEESKNNLLDEIRNRYPELVFNGDPKKDWPKVLFHKGGGQDHIAMKTVCDIHVDVPKYNGHSTSGDLLWGGVPILTEPLTTMASRAAASFAITSGIQQMAVASSEEDYITKGVYYGTNKAELAKVRKKLEDERMDNPLFDTYLFTKHLEDAYTQMMKIKFIDELEPRSIDVNNLIDTYGSKAIRMKKEGQNLKEENGEAEDQQNEPIQKDEEEKPKETQMGPKDIGQMIEDKKEELELLQKQKDNKDYLLKNPKGAIKGLLDGQANEVAKGIDVIKDLFNQNKRPGAELNPIAAAREDGEDNVGVNDAKIILPNK